MNSRLAPSRYSAFFSIDVSVISFKYIPMFGKNAYGLSTAHSVVIAPSTTTCRIGNSSTVMPALIPTEIKLFRSNSIVYSTGSIDLHNTLGS